MERRRRTFGMAPVVVLTVLLLAFPPVRPSPILPDPARASGLAPVRAPLGPESRGSTPGIEPHVLATLGLLNDSVVTGNVPMAQGLQPLGIAFDSLTGLYYIGYGGPNGIAEYNATARTVPRVVPVPVGVSVLVDDPATHQLLVPMNNSTFVYGASNLSLVRKLPAGSPIASLALDAANQTAFVSLSGKPTVEEFNVTTGARVRLISVLGQAEGLAYSPDSGDVYVADAGTSNVSVFAAGTGAFVATVRVGPAPLAVAYDAAARAVVVTHPPQNNVTVISDRTQKFVANVSVGADPVAVTANPRTSEVYVANELLGSSVSVVNLSTDSVDGTVATGLLSLPDALATDPAGRQVVVPLLAPQAVAVIGAARPFPLLSSVSLVAAPQSMAEDAANRTVFLADFVRNELVGVNETSGRITANRSVGHEPTSVVDDPAHNRLYVTFGGSAVRALNATTLANETVIGVGTNPQRMALDAPDHLLLVPNYYPTDHNVSIIDTNTERVVRTMTTCDGPVAATYDPDNRWAYVICLGGSVSILDPVAGVYHGNITLRSYGSSIAFDPFTRAILAVSTEPDHLEVIDPANSSVVYRLPLPLNSYQVAVDTADRELLIGAQGYNLTVLNATSYGLVGYLPVGEESLAVAFSNATDRAFVADTYSGSVSILAAGTPRPPYIGQFVARPNPVTIGNSTTLSVVAAGDGPVGYRYSGLPTPCVGANRSSLTCTPGSVGNYTVNVTVTDLHGRASVAHLWLRVSRAPLVLRTVVITPASGVSTVTGRTVNLSASATFDDGSNATDFVALSWSVAPPELCHLNTTSGPFVNCTAQIVGNGTVTVRATLNGTSLTATSALHVAAPPRVLGSVSLAPSSVVLPINGSASVVASAFDIYGRSIGSGPTFTWSIAPVALGTFNTTSGPRVLFLAGARSGTGTLNVSASWNGVVRTASSTVDVSTSVRQLGSVEIAPTAASVVANNTMVFSATALDTTGRAISAGPVYTWAFHPAGLGRLTASSGSSVTFAAGPTPVNGTLTVTAGWEGRTLTTNASVQVVPADSGRPTGPAGGSSGPVPPWVWGVLAVAAVAAALATVVLLVRRRRREPPLPEPSGSIVSAGPRPDEPPELPPHDT
ncbi:MAG TPA: hypothetical protein VFF67_09215 [Thermoplasmata archaeon]|nr:hypothetical protein [Thermoplasmata archaeon]